MQKSFAPLTGVLLFDRTNLSSQEVSLPLYLLDDCRRLNGKDYTVSVTVYNDRLDTVVCREFNGHSELETVKNLGNLDLNRVQTKSTMLFFVVDVCSEGKRLSRNYYFTNYEVRRGVIMSMPRTEKLFVARSGRVANYRGECRLSGLRERLEYKLGKQILYEKSSFCSCVRFVIVQL